MAIELGPAKISAPMVPGAPSRGFSLNTKITFGSKAIGVTERMAYILRVRKLALAICAAYVAPPESREPEADSREPK